MLNRSICTNVTRLTNLLILRRGDAIAFFNFSHLHMHSSARELCKQGHVERRKERTIQKLEELVNTVRKHPTNIVRLD
ncbi:hypothetical protein POVWA2_045020 [Plasmodium ovale wallikeri]|uniref:Uncharacterized protein n=1 Tax=Plasmodium ovale wallikeri TaxID=864142 RepID=A0A1A8ZF77_PLAOA|nr:hypothetical protein POVWA1_046470 [Plasmodium ovale wallikeri]SBT42938.1 hypothetical protein POVWA2_045020 [Plasmodium ovale wallikeri]